MTTAEEPNEELQAELETQDGQALQSRTASSPLPFADLEAPQPLDPTPPAGARILAFGSILVGGLLGALVGYGTTDLMTEGPVLAAIGGLVGAVLGAVGVGIVASLTLRAMNEWHAVNHPEALKQSSSIKRGRTGSPGSSPTTGSSTTTGNGVPHDH